MEPGFFDQVRDAFEGFVAGLDGELHTYVHGRGLKVWYAATPKEHYEAQLLRVDGDSRLEIGFHTEHSKPKDNDEVMQHLMACEAAWRAELGDEAEAAPFIGRDGWRRLSELWEVPDQGEVDAAIEVAARLADYVMTLEPIRASTSSNKATAAGLLFDDEVSQAR